MSELRQQENRKRSWRDSDVDASKIWRFNVNYRNPATIADFAKDITENRY